MKNKPTKAIKAQFEAKEVVEVSDIQEEKVEEVTEEKPAVQGCLKFFDIFFEASKTLYILFLKYM